MRVINIIFIWLLIFVVQLTQTYAQSIKVHGNIINPKKEEISFSYFNNPLQQLLIEKKYNLDSKNQFYSEFDFLTPTLLEFQYDDNTQKLYVEPGDNIYIQFDGNNFYQSWQVTGKGSTNNNFLNNLNKKYPILKRYQFVSSDIEQYFHSVDSLLLEMQTYISVESKKQSLSNNFLDYIQSDILFQAAINKIFYIQKNFVMSGNINEQTMEYLDFMKNINVNSENNLYVESFPKLLVMYLDCIYQIENPELIFKLRTTNVPLLEESERIKLFKKIASIRHKIAKEKLHGKILDFFISRELTGLFDEGWFEPFEQLYEEYRNNGILTEYTDIIDSALENAYRLMAGEQAPNITLFDIDDNEISLNNLNGKVLLLNFWATWCPGCKTNAPEIKKVQAYFSNQDFLLVNISMNENKKVWKDAVHKEQLNGLHLFSNGFTSQTARDYNIQGIPSYFLLDMNGKIVEKIKGLFNSKIIINKIEKLL